MEVELEQKLGVEARTLSALTEMGTIRGVGGDWHKLRKGEAEWLIKHWGLVKSLQEALKTERLVKVAFIFGSYAKGSEREDSDLDLLVDMENETFTTQSGLHNRLEKKIGRKVDLFWLSNLVNEEDGKRNFLLENIIKELRPVVNHKDKLRGNKTRRA